MTDLWRVRVGGLAGKDGRVYNSAESPFGIVSMCGHWGSSV